MHGSNTAGAPRDSGIDVSRFITIGIVLIGLASVVAALLRAPLTWDGAYYFYEILQSGDPFHAHDRIAGRVIHWPAAGALRLTDNPAVAMVVFNLAHVITPALALWLCWWQLRRTQPRLMVWPTLGVVMAMLPGQINYISEAIKAEQLFWPLLIAMLVGLPARSIAIAIATTAAIYWLHPAATPLFLAAAMAAIALGILRKPERMRLLVAATALLVLAALRWQLTGQGSQQSEMSVDTQLRQWENGVSGAPTGLVIVLIVVIGSLLVSPYVSDRHRNAFGRVQAIFAAGGCLMLIPWAIDSTQWWQALEFRGPAFWLTMLTAGACVLHELMLLLVPAFRQVRADWLQGTGARLSLIVCACAAVILVLQSATWAGVIGDLEEQIDSATQACIAREDLPDMPTNPLNLWSTLHLSLLLQGSKPGHISMEADECQQAIHTGEIYLFGNPILIQGDAIDGSRIVATLPNASACTWTETTGWHQREALIPDSWQWSDGEATVTIDTERAGQWELRGDVLSVSGDMEIELWVNGTYKSTVHANSDDGTQIDGTMVNLEAGANTLTFRTDAAPTVIPGDGRELTFSLWNFTVRADDGSAPCTRTDSP